MKGILLSMETFIETVQWLIGLRNTMMMDVSSDE